MRGLYSPIDKLAAELPRPRGTGAEFMAELSKRPGYRQQEVEDRGLQALMNLPKMERAQFMQALQSRPVPAVQEKVLGGQPPKQEVIRRANANAREAAERFAVSADSFGEARQMRADELRRARESRQEMLGQAEKELQTPTHHEQWTLPGGENYREMLIKAPQEKGYITPNGAFFSEQDLADPAVYKTAKRIGLSPAYRPIGEQFPGAPGHFGGEPGILASMRLKDRTVPGDMGYTLINKKSGNKSQHYATVEEAQTAMQNMPESIRPMLSIQPSRGPDKKLLHLEELQSDWHQKGRDEGYRKPKQLFVPVEKMPENYSVSWGKSGHTLREEPSGKVLYNTGTALSGHGKSDVDIYNEWAQKQHEKQKMEGAVPDAPFKKNWEEMALKKLIHHAAENGYHGIVVTPGQEQADRYKLSNHIDGIKFNKMPDGNIFWTAQKNGSRVTGGDNKPEELDSVLGKEVASQIRNRMDEGPGELSGLDLQIGGEGMKAFYDKKVPNILNSIGKKYGAKVKQIQVPVEKGIEPGWVTKPAAPRNVALHHFPITEEMRKDVVKNGLPLYAEGGRVPHLAIGGQGPKNWIKGSVERVIKPLLHPMNPDEAAGIQAHYDKIAPHYDLNNPREVWELGQMRQHIQVMKGHEAVNQWIERNLANYIKKQMATHDDPIRKLAEQGIVHMPTDQVGMNRYKANTHRATHGAERLGQSEEAQAWEDAADVAINRTKIKNLLGGEFEEPWMQKANPETHLYYPRGMDAHYLGFDHLVDILKQDLAEGRIRPEQLSKVSIEQAVRRAHQYDQERKKAMAETALKATEGMPVHKDYGNGYKWIELVANKNEEPTEDGFGNVSSPGYENLENALQYEGDTMGHCVGGYCPDVYEGRSRIFSLRDAKNEPHVTIETKPNPYPLGDEQFFRLSLEERKKLREHIMQWRSRNPHIEDLDDEHVIQAWREAGVPIQPNRIVQIKGKGNAKPKKDYIPYVQDFVKSGNWSDVGDLTNADLYHVHPESDVAKNLAAAGEQVPTYVTNDELTAINRRFRKAHGGVVHKAKGGVLSRHEHDANLAKFLEPSAVKNRMYHSTSRNFSVFDRLASTKTRRASMDTVGSWFSSNPDKAAGYAGGEGHNVMPVYLSIKNPKLYSRFDDFLRDMHEAEGRKLEEQNPKGIGSTEGLRKKLMAQGYDGIQFEQTNNARLYEDIEAMQQAIKQARLDEWSVNRLEREPYTMKRERLENTLRSMRDELNKMGGSTEFDGHDVFVAFHPHQIKSAIGNRGTYDPKNPDITKANGGSIKPVGYTKERVTVSPNLDSMRYELESVKHYTKKVK